MRRRRRNDSGGASVAVAPWWAWLILAAVAWGVARYLMGFSPGPKPTLPQVVQTSLLHAAGFFLYLLGPLMCVLMAILAGVQGAKARRSLPQTNLEVPSSSSPYSEKPLPRWGTDAIDSYQVWKDVGKADGVSNVDVRSWNVGLLKSLEWKRFEQLCALYFRSLKFRVEEATHGPDGGVDLRLYAGEARSAGVLVQCKAWNSWKVGVKEIRELFGVMAAEGISEGAFVTTSTFSKEAITFSRGKNIVLVDGDDLLKKLLALPAEDQTHILTLVTAGDFRTPTCPSCGIKMVKRSGKGDEPFRGCVAYPRCRSKLSIARRGSPGK